MAKLGRAARSTAVATLARTGLTSDGAAAPGRRAMLSFVDELASLAADLWFAGKLEFFPAEEEPADGDDD
jgi:hypothetical protein